MGLLADERIQQVVRDCQRARAEAMRAGRYAAGAGVDDPVWTGVAAAGGVSGRAGDAADAKCAFRPIVTARSGVVTADFGIVTGRSGIVTDRAEPAGAGCV